MVADAPKPQGALLGLEDTEDPAASRERTDAHALFASHSLSDEHRREDERREAVAPREHDRSSALCQTIDYRGGRPRRTGGRTRSVAGYSRPSGDRIELA